MFMMMISFTEQIIDLGSKNSSLVSVVMEETGSLGVDVIIDDGGK